MRNGLKADYKILVKSTTCGQFPQQLLPQYLCARKVQTLNLSTKQLFVKLSYKKATREMLVKSTTCGQIPQQLLPRYFCAKKVQTLNLSTKQLFVKLLYK
jgi:hypothetical protein